MKMIRRKLTIKSLIVTATILFLAANPMAAPINPLQTGQDVKFAGLSPVLKYVMSDQFSKDDTAYGIKTSVMGYKAVNVRQGINAYMATEGMSLEKGNARWTISLDGVAYGVDTTGAFYPVVIDPLVQSAKLTASDVVAGDQLGYSVSVSSDGNTIVAGAKNAPYGGPGAISSGVIYVFTKPAGSSWSTSNTYTAKLTASDGVAGDNLGWSVAISPDGSTIAAGAVFAIIGNNPQQGAVYVFTKPANGWKNNKESAKLTASAGAAYDLLGFSVSVSSNGGTIAAGLYYNANQFRTGAAYVFTKPSGGWANTVQSAKLTASDGVSIDELGYSVAVSSDGNTVFAGAPFAVSGAVYVFTKPGGGWANTVQSAKLTASDSLFDFAQLGNSVAASSDGSTLAAGAYLATIGGNGWQGAVYVFTKPAGGWTNSTESAKLTASDGLTNDLMGNSVAISSDGGIIVSGANLAPYTGSAGPGVVYVFTRPGSRWSSVQESAKLMTSDGTPGYGNAMGDALGWSVSSSSDGGTVFSGAFINNSQRGAVYVFSLNMIKAYCAGVNSGTITETSGGGMIDTACNGTALTGTNMEVVNPGTNHTLTATGNAGVNVTWSGGCDSTAGNGTNVATCTINNINASKNITATFSVALPNYNITLTASGVNKGTISETNGGGVINAMWDGTALSGATVEVVQSGTSHTITAASSTGIAWSGGCDSTSGNGANSASCTINKISADKNITATFSTTSYTGASATGNGNVTVSFTGGGAAAVLSNPSLIAVTGGNGSPPKGTAPQAYTFPDGLLSFTINNITPVGSTITLTLTYPNTLPANTVYWKYGPTASNNAPHWYTIPANVSGNTITITITDGGLGDDDLSANGTITDAGGPGVPPPDNVTYRFPYFHTAAANEVFCVASNLTGQAATVTFQPKAGGAYNASTFTPINLGTLQANGTDMYTFNGNTATSLVGGAKQTISGPDTSSKGAFYGAYLSFDATSIGILNCTTIMVACFQGTTSPKRNLVGYLCIDTSSGFFSY